MLEKGGGEKPIVHRPRSFQRSISVGRDGEEKKKGERVSFLFSPFWTRGGWDSTGGGKKKHQRPYTYPRFYSKTLNILLHKEGRGQGRGKTMHT